MSEIPVGTPPTPAGRHAAPSGWYPDPVDPRQERYWDGWQWSRNTRPRGAAPDGGSVAPFTAPPRPSAGVQDYPPSSAGSSSAGSGPAGSNYPPGPGYPPAGSGYPPQGYPASYAAGSGRLPITADGVRLAGWWWRALAVILDSILVSLILSPINLLVYRPAVQAFVTWFQAAMTASQAGSPAPAPPSVATLISAGDGWRLLALTLGVQAAYNLLFLRRWGATPGKFACGLRVVPVDQGRHPGGLGWNAAGMRTAVWILPNLYSLLFVVRLVDVLFPLWHPKRQALHDLGAGTQVVRPHRLPANAGR